MAAGRYVLAAEKLLRALGPESAIAGGVAVNAHGFPRSTRDVDIITSIPLTEARERLKAGGISAVLRTGDPAEGDIPCLSGVVGVPARGKRISGIPFDVLPNLVTFASEELEFEGRRLRIVDADSLIRLKLKAGSSKDLYDVAVLAHLDPGLRPRAEALAATNADLLARLAVFLGDPRTAKQAREIRRQDRALRRFERKR